ncbi:insulin-like growth factor-binding protein-related protein 1 [Palaemon carinicauda]|uniref:insulin-like growth factor-binding protein-related protein 1 n=1 Tax=Palaemon carinicauda TaxID=392227 RepID=UPI0035B64534
MALGTRGLLVALFAFGGIFASAEGGPECEPCHRAECPDVGKCIGGTVMDVCGCCVVCARGLGQRCDMDSDETKEYGKCGEYLTCTKRTDIGDVEEGTCECEQTGAVCGSDGVTYDTLCHLLEKTAENEELTAVSREPCKAAPVIKSRPKDAVRPLGSIMVLDCEAIGFPVPDLFWELNMADGSSYKLPSDNPGFAIQIRGGPEKHMVTTWAQIMRINEETVGTYTCVAKNSEGEDRAAAKISLRDQDKPASENEI